MIPMRIFPALLALLLSIASAHAHGSDPLPSWNPGKAKAAILQFVQAVSTPGSKQYVEPAERIAVFDHDGTLWVEYPMYTQALFAFDRVRKLAPQHPEWKSRQPFRGVLEHDMQAVAATGTRGLLELVLATHSGMSAQAFSAEARHWLQTARHPVLKRAYIELVYQPQLELLAYLRKHGFKTFIVSGGGAAFMRPVSEQLYGIPPEQVIGSGIVSRFVMQDGRYQLIRMPEIRFINDKADKPVGIYEHIGRRPILAFGNSDSDRQMIEYTMSGDGPHLALFVHHTDAAREFSYDRTSHVGRLDQVLDMAGRQGWVIVDMKRDWNVVFPFERKSHAASPAVGHMP